MIQETAILFPLKFDILAITETYLIITSVPSKILHHGAHNPGISNHHLIYAVISLRRFSQQPKTKLIFDQKVERNALQSEFASAP